MKILLKSLFFVLAVSILSYSAVEAGAPWIFTATAEGRVCCTYQMDCPEAKVCKDISIDCSEQQPHICSDPIIE